jgi:hypothetical protein
MELEKHFDVACARERAVEIAARDETLTGLFPDSPTAISESTERRKTTVTRYTALGREGSATFKFDFEPDGNLRFQKVCDGNVWRELSGTLRFEERRRGTRVHVTMQGRTKSLVPEFTIKGPMKDQLEEMAGALRERLEADA